MDLESALSSLDDMHTAIEELGGSGSAHSVTADYLRWSERGCHSWGRRMLEIVDRSLVLFSCYVYERGFEQLVGNASYCIVRTSDVSSPSEEIHIYSISHFMSVYTLLNSVVHKAFLLIP